MIRALTIAMLAPLALLATTAFASAADECPDWQTDWDAHLACLWGPGAIIVDGVDEGTAPEIVTEAQEVAAYSVEPAAKIVTEAQEVAAYSDELAAELRAPAHEVACADGGFSLKVYESRDQEVAAVSWFDLGLIAGELDCPDFWTTLTDEGAWFIFEVVTSD